MHQQRYMFIFTHIVEQGSITAAAEHLELSKSVISQQLKNLENELGVTLLKRTTRRQTLTAAGQVFYESCRDINFLTEKAWQQAKDTLQAPQGPIKIVAPVALIGSLVVPALAKVMKQYPLLKPELISCDQNLDIGAENIDLAIRSRVSDVGELKQRKVGEIRDVLCGHHDLLNQGIDENIPYIANLWQGSSISHEFEHKKTGDPMEYVASAHCRTNSFNSCLGFIIEGAGIGLVPDFVFNQMRDVLGEAFPEYQLSSDTVYAVHPYNKHLPMSVAVSLDAIELELFKSL